MRDKSALRGYFVIAILIAVIAVVVTSLVTGRHDRTRMSPQPVVAEEATAEEAAEEDQADDTRQERIWRGTM